MGMCMYRRVHNTILVCVRIIIPLVSSERICELCLGLSWVEINKKHNEFNFHVFLTSGYFTSFKYLNN